MANPVESRILVLPLVVVFLLVSVESAVGQQLLQCRPIEVSGLAGRPAREARTISWTMNVSLAVDDRASRYADSPTVRPQRPRRGSLARAGTDAVVQVASISRTSRW